MNKAINNIAVLILLLCCFASQAQTTVIYAGQLLAVPGESPVKQQTIVINNKRISAVHSGYTDASQFAKDTIFIDLKDQFVLPGLMDMHVHLQGELSATNTEDSLKMSSELMAMRSTHYGKKTLMAGFTTVRDLGSQTQYMYAYRDAVNQGWVDGPRIIAAGKVGITGGHMDDSGMKHELLEFYMKNSVCDGPYDCRRATRNAIKFGADWIKIASTGGVLTDRATGTGQQMEADELKEVVLAAKRMGRKVAAHAHHEDGIIAALKAGVASIEHGSYAGPKAIKLFKKTGAYMVPTLLAGHTVVGMAESSEFMSPAIRAKAIKVGNDMKGTFVKAYKAGVKIAFGTDSGVSQHGSNAQEAVLMFEAGMPAAQVIKSATVNAADLLGMSEEVGTIAVDKYADIIAVGESPLQNISTLLDVKFVMKEGQVYKN